LGRARKKCPWNRKLKFTAASWMQRSRASEKLPSILRPEIDDEHVVKHRPDQLAEIFVRGVIDVSVAVFLAVEA
jgi:hypothetical protein